MLNAVSLRAATLACLLLAAGAHAGTLAIGISWESVDTDFDSIADRWDNAPYHANPDQMDTDTDQLGDVADPGPFAIDFDGDGTIDSGDAQPSNLFVDSITYALGGPYVISVGQVFAVSLTPTAASYTGYDRLALSLDGSPGVAHFFLHPGDSSILLVGGNMNLTPGVHTLGVTSFYTGILSPSARETFTTITVLPEPASLVVLVGAAAASLRRQRR